MENKLFYSYLNWRKNKDKGIKNKIKRLPTTAIILISLLIVSTVTLMIFSFSLVNIMYIPMIAIVILTIISFLYTEHEQTKNYKVSYKNYKDECNELKAHFSEMKNFTREEIQEYKNRVLLIIDDNESKLKEANEKLFSLFKLFVFPILLTLLSQYINFNNNFEASVNVIFIILICAGAIFIAASAVIRLCFSFITYKTIQYKEFSDKLQGILDICKFE